MSQHTNQYHFLKEQNKSFQIPLTDLDFLLTSAKNFKNNTIFGNLRIITQQGDKETRQMTPLFSSTF